MLMMIAMTMQVAEMNPEYGTRGDVAETAHTIIDMIRSALGHRLL